MAWSLLDSGNPVLSLLSNVATAGRIGPDQVQPQGPTEDGAPVPTSMGPTQQQSALDAILAAGRTLSAAGSPTYGPPRNVMGAIGDALSQGRLAQQQDEIYNQAAIDAQLRRNILQQQLQDAAWTSGIIRQAYGATAPQPATGAAEPGTATGPSGPAPGYVPGAAIEPKLMHGEAQGPNRYSLVNAGGYSGAYQLGGPLAKDAGFYTPGPNETIGTDGTWSGDKFSGTFKIPGYDNVRTHADFLANPQAQRQAYLIAMGRNDQMLQANGAYDRGVGKTINGVPVTREGLLGGAWLGGVNGVKRWVDSNGREDPVDANGTPISRWVQLGSGMGDGGQPGTATATGGAPATAPATPAAAPGAPARPQFAGPGAPGTVVATDSTGAAPGPVATAGGAGGPPATPAPGTVTAQATPPSPAQPAPGATAANPNNPLPGLSRQQLLSVAMLPWDKRGAAIAELYAKDHGTLEVADQSGKGQIYQRNPDGTRGTWLGTKPTELRTTDMPNADGTMGVWSLNPDGTPAAYIGPSAKAPNTVRARNPDNTMGIYIQKPDGTLGKKIADEQTETKTMELANPDGTGALFLQNPDGTKGPKIGDKPRNADTIEMRSPTGDIGIYVKKPDGTAGQFVGWAPHDARTVEISNPDNTTSVFKLNPDGSLGQKIGDKAREIKTVEVANPDGTGALHLQNPDGSLGTKIGDKPRNAETMNVQMPGGQTGIYVKKPDGTQGAFVGLAPQPPSSLPLDPLRAAQEERLRRAAFTPPYEAERGKQVAEGIGAIQTNSTKAVSQLQNVQQLEALAQRAASGRMSDITTTVGSLADSFGLDLKGLGIPGITRDNLVTSQIMNKVTNTLVRSMIGGEGGFPANNFSDADRQFLTQSVPNMKSTDTANKMMAWAMKEALQRQIDKGQAWANRPDSDRGPGEQAAAERFMADWDKKMAAAPIIHQGDVPYTEKDINALQPGTIFHIAGDKDKNGNDVWRQRQRGGPSFKMPGTQ